MSEPPALEEGGLPAFPTEWDSDEERGKGLLAWWMAAVAEKNGIAPDAIPPDFAEAVRAAVLEVEADSAMLAPLEKALQLAARGDFANAGRIILEHIKTGAYLMAAPRIIERMAPDAKIGKARREQQRTFARAKHEQTLAEREPEWERWKAEGDRIQGTRARKASKRYLAELVKESLSLPDPAETIRKHL